MNMKVGKRGTRPWVPSSEANEVIECTRVPRDRYATAMHLFNLSAVQFPIAHIAHIASGPVN